jgi:2-keto-4-pentenoate hydratase/2-oxohepta-3-ene-1,7-dioic acid hydratase in catechol pathway
MSSPIDAARELPMANEAPHLAAIRNLVIAGWTGRDEAAMEAHIRELEALGIARPKSTPIFYRVAGSLLTAAPTIQIPGETSSGEVEAVLLSLPGGLHIAVGSDHTDRKVEAYNVTVSKQMCAKPVSAASWRFEEVEDHWDRLVLRSFATVGGARRAYQEGTAAKMRHPRDLMERYLGPGRTLPPGTAMFCGTLAVLGEIAPAEIFEVELEDPVRGHTLSHRYAVETLPVEG